MAWNHSEDEEREQTKKTWESQIKFQTRLKAGSAQGRESRAAVPAHICLSRDRVERTRALNANHCQERERSDHLVRDRTRSNMCKEEV